MVSPPSTAMAWPLTKLDESLASHRAHSAMSRGRPDRCIGATSASTASMTATVFCAAWPSRPAPRPKMDVAIPPGQMALTRTPSSPSSLAVVRVRWAMAALHAL